MGKGKKSRKAATPPTLVEETPVVPTRGEALRARWSAVRVSATVFSVGGVIAFLLGGWAFGPYIGGGVQLSAAQETCKTVKGHDVCVPTVSEDGAALVKVTADGWARYADGTKWDGSDFR